MSSRPSNSDRADFAQQAMEAYMRATGADEESAFRDFVGDFCHLVELDNDWSHAFGLPDDPAPYRVDKLIRDEVAAGVSNYEVEGECPVCVDADSPLDHTCG